MHLTISIKTRLHWFYLIKLHDWTTVWYYITYCDELVFQNYLIKLKQLSRKVCVCCLLWFEDPYDLCYTDIIHFTKLRQWKLQASMWQGVSELEYLFDKMCFLMNLYIQWMFRVMFALEICHVEFSSKHDMPFHGAWAQI